MKGAVLLQPLLFYVMNCKIIFLYKTILYNIVIEIMYIGGRIWLL